MCQRLNTGESSNFYFGIFICIGPTLQTLPEAGVGTSNIPIGRIMQSAGWLRETTFSQFYERPLHVKKETNLSLE